MNRIVFCLVVLLAQYAPPLAPTPSVDEQSDRTKAIVEKFQKNVNDAADNLIRDVREQLREEREAAAQQRAKSSDK